MTIAANVNQCLATIQGIETQLSELALNSEDEHAKRTFHEVMLVICDVKEDIHSRVNELEFEEPQYRGS